MPPRKLVSDFMVELRQKLKDARELSESTLDSYFSILTKLNDGKSFSNLGFLKNKDSILAKIQTHAESTQKTNLVAIVSCLSLYQDKPTYKGMYNFFYERMMEAIKREDGKDKSVKSKTQEDNWMKWDDVLKVRDELAAKFATIAKAKMVTPDMWESALAYLLVSLYTYIPPRRNQDYQELYVVKKWTDAMPKDKNYYDLATRTFVFNKYKTAKSNGVEKIKIESDNPLHDVIVSFLKLQPGKKPAEVRLLVNADGSALTATNSVTRILNKVFGRKVGSSMLRHIYLSSKYGDTLEDMKSDSAAMGHSLNMQREYIKKDTPKEEVQVVEVPTAA